MLAEQPSPNSPEPRARNKSQPQRASDRSSPDIGDGPTRKMEGRRQQDPERKASGGWHLGSTAKRPETRGRAGPAPEAQKFLG